MSSETYTPQLEAQSVLLLNKEQRELLAKEHLEGLIQESVGKSVSEVRSKIAAATEAKTLDAALVGDYETKLTAAIGEHGNVKVENLGGTTMGVNYEVGTKNTAVDSRMVGVDAVRTNNKQLAEVLDHENSEELGHAGQVQVQSVIGTDGKVHDSRTVLEGDVETNMTKKYGQRADQPKEVYGEGEAFVQEAGADTVGNYTRGKADRATTQAEIFKQDNSLSAEDQIELMEAAEFTAPEIADVIKQTRADFENGPNSNRKNSAQKAVAIAA